MEFMTVSQVLGCLADNFCDENKESWQMKSTHCVADNLKVSVLIFLSYLSAPWLENITKGFPINHSDWPFNFFQANAAYYLASKTDVKCSQTTKLHVNYSRHFLLLDWSKQKTMQKGLCSFSKRILNSPFISAAKIITHLSISRI